ncbi:MAG: PEP/pyruvate-binding domain-containing protein, partial [Candidatus Omnitrophota bacterium]|nr:PEP/pyruvate-binding domain-containing protein [Candidatus Omnitrophota bacterium]
MNKIIIALIFILCVVTNIVRASEASREQEAAYCLRPPIITGERIKHIEVRALFERENKILGGKGANDLITESLAEKLGFKTIPNTVRFTIQNIWGEFIRHNKTLVDKGNAIVEKTGGRLTSEDAGKLRQLIEDFEFSRELEKSVETSTEHVQDNSIDRSSGLWEDSYERNLAGVFISLKQDDKKLIVKNIKKILYHGVSVIWIDQNTAKRPMEGVPNTLSPEQGIGFLVQDFIDFDASGTAMSNLYGNTSIEVVMGDLELAVNAKSPYAKFPNIGKFIFPKDTADETFEYDTPFSDYPHTFRIKEKVYSPEINPEKRLEILRQYESSHGRINGKFSAISAEQAKRLNKVINALEAETGVPIDVEWGFKDNELYIVQRRPLIGDFPLVFVEKSAKFSEFSKINPAICSTSIALGHTSQEGFTGKIVLFGDIVNEETIEVLENELNAPYIRLQNDVASHVDGLNTKAKVLVDVSMGSVQAHNVDLITDRISTGEFCYASGPALRDSLDRHITFIPHPELRGVWVSLEDVTYFGSGLKGEFYVSENNKAPMLKLNSRQKTLIAFHKAMQKPLADRNTNIEYPLLDVLLNVSSGLIPTIFYPIYFENTDLEYFLRAVKDGKLGLSNIEKIESFYADDIQEALSYPLYPASWESPAMNKLRKLLIFKGISQAIKARLNPADSGSEKFYAVFLSEESWVESMKETLPDDCPGMIAIHEYGFDSVEFALKQIGYKAQVFYTHIHTDNAQELIDRILIPIKSANPDAKIFVATRGLIPESLKVFARSYTNTNVAQRTGPKGSLPEIIQSSARRDYYEWQDKQTLQPHYAQKPERPEKLNILFLDDDPNILRHIENISLGELSEEEYQGFFATDYDEACNIIESNRIDAVVFDIRGRGSEIDINRFCVDLNRIPYVRVLSGADLGDMDTFVNNRLMSIKERV